jgi:hypothetical protein
MRTTILDGNSNLSESSLALSLNATCRALAYAVIKGGSELSASVIDEYIPGEVFKAAIHARWISAPQRASKTVVMLGGYPVAKAYHEQFIELLKPTFDEVGLRGYVRGWIEPTPSQLIRLFKQRSGWSDQKLADETRKAYVGHEFGPREAISVKTIRRIQSTKGNDRHNARGFILRSVAQVMKRERDHDPDFHRLHWHSLQWRKKDL